MTFSTVVLLFGVCFVLLGGCFVVFGVVFMLVALVCGGIGCFIMICLVLLLRCCFW